jgi:hypothetical protein
MGTVHRELSDSLRQWIGRQHVFFVASAPLADDGHVNVSPKGMAGTLQILDSTTVAYLDLTGSGIETVAHVNENGRLTLMWCAFEGPPRIVRMQGRGEVVLEGDPRWDALMAGFGEHRGVRSVIVLQADRISDSCGYSVPLMTYEADRTRLAEWASNRTDAELQQYWVDKNSTSIDGLPALEPGR